MFQTAIKAAQLYTLPIVVSYRRQNGGTDSAIGAFIILNDDGWILTAWHIVDEITKLANEQQLYRSYQAEVTKINADTTTTKVQKKKLTRSLAKPPNNSVTHFSPWWGRDGWQVTSFVLDPLADLAAGKIENFDKSCVSGYPTFKNPAHHFDVGQMLCKYGFPFHSIKPTFDETKNTFQLPPAALPIPLFPIEGMFTRTLVANQGAEEFVETSSPGLRGQSGGPTFDEQGRIWAMQSRTIHHPLGFSPKAPNQANKEHQFLNAGMGAHVNTIMKFLNTAQIKYALSTD